MMAVLPKARIPVHVGKAARGVSGGKFASPSAPGSRAGLSTKLDFLGSHRYLIKMSTIAPEDGCCSLNAAEQYTVKPAEAVEEKCQTTCYRNLRRFLPMDKVQE